MYHFSLQLTKLTSSTNCLTKADQSDSDSYTLPFKCCFLSTFLKKNKISNKKLCIFVFLVQKHRLTFKSSVSIAKKGSDFTSGVGGFLGLGLGFGSSFFSCFLGLGFSTLAGFFRDPPIINHQLISAQTVTFLNSEIKKNSVSFLSHSNTFNQRSLTDTVAKIISLVQNKYLKYNILSDFFAITVKSVIAVTSIQQLLTTKCQYFVVKNVHFKFTCFKQSPALKGHFYPVSWLAVLSIHMFFKM